MAALTKVEKPSNSAVRYGKTTSVTDKGITKYSYEDNFIDILIFAGSTQFNFILKNISDNTLKVVWNEAVFVDVDGSTSKVMHSGIKYSQREADQPASTIIKGAKLEDLAAPTDKVYYSDILKDLSKEHELFVVVGGGKPAREYIGVVRDLGAGEAQCDDIGIEVTRINAKLLLSALGDAAYQRVPHNFQEALEFSASGKIIVMGGTEPAHSTDAVSAILAEYIHADKLINLTSVDGMYTKDPNKFDDAELVPEISATDLLEFLSGKDVKAGTYEFFDTTAVQMIKRSDLETVITNGFEPENLIKAVNGEKIGTKVINE